MSWSVRLVVSSVLVAILLGAHAARAQDSKTILDIRAEYVWREIYIGAGEKKAIASAANGAIGVGYDGITQEEADRTALDYCNEHSKFMSLRNPPAPECTLFSSGDTWTSPSLIPDPDWQKPITGKDISMLKGRKYVISNSKGIILHVHGCNGLGDKIFTDVWGAYFNALGYDFYAPDSFAVKRPKDVCGVANDYPPEQISTVWRLRIAQTQRTLADLKAAHPGKPIYLFGHSEGGLIVQMIEAYVDGIIVSGEECGVFGGPIAAPSTVPMLYLWGEYDQYVNGMGLRLSNDSPKKCEKDFATHKPQFAILEGRTHIPWPWNPKVNAAVASFMRAEKPHDLVVTNAGKKGFADWKHTRVPKSYKTAKQHRAAAIGAGGRSYMVWGLDNLDDASNLALYGCTRSVSKTNVFKTGKYACSVVDVNGAAPR